jgi:hypothetical protein
LAPLCFYIIVCGFLHAGAISAPSTSNTRIPGVVLLSLVPTCAEDEGNLRTKPESPALALQIGLRNQGQLVAAFQAWTLEKARGLADHLVGRGGLEADNRSGVGRSEIAG